MLHHFEPHHELTCLWTSDTKKAMQPSTITAISNVRRRKRVGNYIVHELVTNSKMQLPLVEFALLFSLASKQTKIFS